MNDKIEMKMKIENKNKIENIDSRSESIKLNFIKQWKGGRLKKRLNAHASLIGQLMHSLQNVLDFLMASWLSPMNLIQRFPRGKKNTLICLVLLIDNNYKN